MNTDSASIPSPTATTSTVTPPPMDHLPPSYVRYRFYILLGLIWFGAILRFTSLDRPPLWGDEALTYSRVIGTFPEMMDILRLDGFMPFHYWSYWWLHQGMPIWRWHLAAGIVLTPRVMRIIPALCGTLMIPAMYFAARQLASVRAALLAAALACMSAYNLSYSHDAKMYAQTWLFVALNLGSFFWWTRTGKPTAWCAWVLTGLLATGFHIAAILIIGLQLVLFLTRGTFYWKRSIFLLLGLSIIAAEPAAYYGLFNQWSQNTGGLLPAASNKTRDGDWNASGIAWIDDMNRNATTMDLLREAASAFVVGTEWKSLDRQEDDPTNPRVRALIGNSFLAIMGFLALGALPWRAAWRSPAPDAQIDPPPLPGWRGFLWLATLMILPIYGFYYCRSIHGFLSPIAWWQWALPAARVPWVWLIVPILIYFSGYSNRQRLIKVGQFAGAAAIIVALSVAVYLFWRHQYDHHWKTMQAIYGADTNAETRPDLDWKSIWVTRYLGVTWPAMAIAICILIMRIPTRWLRWPAIALLLSVNLVNGMARMIAGSMPPQDRVFADVKRVRDSDGATRMVLSSDDPRHRGSARWLRASNYGIYGDDGCYYACLTLGLETTPAEFRNGDVTAQYHEWLGELTMPDSLSSVANAEPLPTRLIIWERYEKYLVPSQMPDEDDIVEAIGPEWKLARPQEIFQLRSWFSWGEMGWMRRREFVRGNQG